MYKIIILVTLLILTSACAVMPDVFTTQNQPDNTSPTVENTSPGAQDQNPPAPIVQDSNGNSKQNTEYTSGSYWLHLFTPVDGEVVNQPEINFTGEVSSETVITLNDEILLIPAAGKFSLPYQLEEGPNVIEVVASSLNGDEITFILTIVYEQ